MATTNFQSGTVIASAWLNDVNSVTYNKTFPDGTVALSTAPGSLIDATSVSYEEGTTGSGAVLRTVANKLQESVSVLDFIPNGVNPGTDVTTYINNAFTALTSTGGNLYFPKGTYKISSILQVPNGVNIFGDGMSSIIKCLNYIPRGIPNGDAQGQCISMGGHNAIRDIYIDGGGFNNGGILVSNQTDVLIDNVWIVNSVAGAQAIQLSVAYNVMVTNCTIVSSTNGIQLFKCLNTLITDCRVSTCSGGGIFMATCQQVTVTGCIVNDLFSMLNKQWDSGNTSDSQLKYWLDPNNTGASDLPGLSPFDATSSCTLFSNSLTGEKDTLMRVTSPAGGYKTGHNNMKITGYAERFTNTDQTLLTSVALGAAKISSTVSNPNSKIVLKIYDEETATALPGNELVSMDVPLSILSGKKMNFIELPSPVVILKHYFVGFEINYSNPKDTFAVYSTPDRNLTIKNSAFAKSGNTWKPFYSYPGLGISTSLLISANGCENTMSKDTVTTNPYAPKYTAIYQQSGLVLYQQIGLSDNLVLQNNGTEVAGTITLYDILGRKLFEVQRVITTSPGSVSTGQLPSGIYFLTIETGKSRQVMKFQVNYPR